MDVKPTVLSHLRLSKQLLTRAEYQHGVPGDPRQVAHDIILAHDAAELALAGICEQLGFKPPSPPTLPVAYLEWLRQLNPPATGVDDASYIGALSEARFDLLLRFRLPEPRTWISVRESMLERIETWCLRCLNLRLEELGSETEGAALCTVRPLGSEQAGGPDRRSSARYRCAGEAQVRVPCGGPPFAGRVINLSLGGCYVEMEPPFELGRRAEVTLRVNKLSFRAAGKVVYTHSFRTIDSAKGRRSQSGMGIRFTGMSEGGRRRLQELIEEFQSAALRRPT